MLAPLRVSASLFTPTMLRLNKATQAAFLYHRAPPHFMPNIVQKRRLHIRFQGRGDAQYAPISVTELSKSYLRHSALVAGAGKGEHGNLAEQWHGEFIRVK